MRRLLVKLVALETALVGWLGYWLFLLYADNPTVAEGLAAQLSRFPQLAFTTVDISVLVIIGVLALFLAFKFQRGLKARLHNNPRLVQLNDPRPLNGTNRRGREKILLLLRGNLQAQASADPHPSLRLLRCPNRAKEDLRAERWTGTRLWTRF